jgi:8-oxo-dGTP pyrophosphatase MutT (NUDIX family)
MPNILFKTSDYVFSYRVAGILIRNGKVLLQRPVGDIGYAFPGGHAGFGETNEETLVREFREETSADIKVNGLRWVGEIFFLWGNKPCHQICLYYDISLRDETQIPLDKSFFATDELGYKEVGLEFSWMSIAGIGDVEVYPANAKQLLRSYNSGIEHFVYKEI